ncbi:MAG: D-alanyl-D-alanine carboxypeptidase [Clostridia bacterium]|nr:D-alanyl-D-alanine carboxypeptidase [Clostridia bacterium]
MKNTRLFGRLHRSRCSHTGGAARFCTIRCLLVSVLLCSLLTAVYASAPDTIAPDEELPVISVGTVSQEFPGTISASSAILVDEEGSVLWAFNADTRMPMASTTKIMTALTVLSAGMDLDASVTIPPEAVGVEGSSIYLYEGESLTAGQLLDAVLMESANDAAAALAIAHAGSLDAFASKMNACAASLGLTDTHFMNPHGLSHREHYTTARELSVIARAAMEYPAFRASVSCYKKEIPLCGSEGVRLLINHNKLLKNLEGCIGIKTGYTKDAGRCLVSACTRDGITLYCVTLDAPDDWNDHTALYEWGFSQVERVVLTEAGEQYAVLPVVGAALAGGGAVQSGSVVSTAVKNTDAHAVILLRSHGEIRRELRCPRFLYAPVSAGDVVGCVVYTDADTGTVYAEVPLYACENVPAYQKPGLWQRIKSLFKIK